MVDAQGIDHGWDGSSHGLKISRYYRWSLEGKWILDKFIAILSEFQDFCERLYDYFKTLLPPSYLNN